MGLPLYFGPSNPLKSSVLFGLTPCKKVCELSGWTVLGLNLSEGYFSSSISRFVGLGFLSFFNWAVFIVSLFLPPAIFVVFEELCDKAGKPLCLGLLCPQGSVHLLSSVTFLFVSPLYTFPLIYKKIDYLVVCLCICPCLCVCVYVHMSMGAWRGQKRLSHPMCGSYRWLWAVCRSREWSMFLWKSSRWLFAAESSPLLLAAGFPLLCGLVHPSLLLPSILLIILCLGLFVSDSEFLLLCFHFVPACIFNFCAKFFFPHS